PRSSNVHRSCGTGTPAGMARRTRASRRWMSGVSGLDTSLTALMKARRPSASVSLAARPGENPCGCVLARTTDAPSLCSSAARTSAGTSSQWTRTPLAGTDGSLEKDASPQLQVVVDPALDGFTHLVGERHHEVLVLGRLGRQVADIDRRMELDPPLARQRDHAQRAQPRPERCDREVGQPKEPGNRTEIADHRIDLL